MIENPMLGMTCEILVEAEVEVGKDPLSETYTIAIVSKKGERLNEASIALNLDG